MKNGRNTAITDNIISGEEKLSLISDLRNIS